MFQKLVLIILPLALILFVASCAKPKPKENKEVEAAIKALRKVQAATQVGVNYQQYGITVIDAKAATNEALGTIPDGDLKKELVGAMDAYSDVNAVWGEKIAGRPYLWTDDEPGKSIVPKYSIPVSEGYGGLKKADLDLSMQLIWAAADAHLNIADSQYKKSLR